MKRIIPIIAISSLLNATNITTLFEGLKHHYKMQLDKNANLAKELVESQLYPKIDIFGSLTHYSLPNAIRPMLLDQCRQAKLRREAKSTSHYYLAKILQELVLIYLCRYLLSLFIQ